MSGIESLRQRFLYRSILLSGCRDGVPQPSNFHRHPMIKTLLSAIAVAGLSLPALQAQQQPVQLKMGDVKVGKPSYEAQKTPNFQAGDVKTKNVPSPRDWLEVEIEFEVDGPRNSVVKELLFRYYVGFKDKSGTARVLTGDVKHVNVLVKEKFYSVAYVAPSTLGEITGDFRRFQPSAVEAVGVEVYYNGVIVGGTTTSNTKFWEAIPGQPGVLGKAETPFALLWIDRYPEVEKSSR